MAKVPVATLPSKSMPAPAPRQQANPVVSQLQAAQAAVAELRQNLTQDRSRQGPVTGGRFPAAPMSTAPQLRGRAGIEAHHDAVATHYNATLAAPPDHYDDDARYRIQINRVVTVEPNKTQLRPTDHSIVVTGKFASSISDAIVAAEQVD